MEERLLLMQIGVSNLIRKKMVRKLLKTLKTVLSIGFQADNPLIDLITSVENFDSNVLFAPAYFYR